MMILHWLTKLPNSHQYIPTYFPVELSKRLPYHSCQYPTHRNTSIAPIDEFFLVLMRLRLGLLEQDLAHQFNVSISTVSRICTTWILFLDQQLRPLITWPCRTLINRHMPSQFKKMYPTTRVIIDCTEIFTETPSSLPLQSATYSPYKHHNTV